MQTAPSRERMQLLLLVCVWSLFMALGAMVGYDLVSSTHERILVREARSHFDKDLAFRRWGAMHGGVYVPVSELTPPNPNLSHVPERDVTTPSGKQLTLVNPAYMQRQLHERFDDLYRVKGHITSLTPLRPENAPDEWERKALEAFENGEEEWMEMVDIGGVPHLRLMRRMMTISTCLKCHADQGYRVGDVRGGVSVAVNAEPHLQYKKRTVQAFVTNSALVWALGLGVIGWYGARSTRRTSERDRALHSLLRTNQALRTISQCNEILVSSTTEQELMDRICNGVVETGGYHFVWVGMAEDDEARTVRPVAHAGGTPEFLNGLEATWDDMPVGSCPTGDAIRTGVPQTMDLIDKNGTPRTWCDRAIRFGFASSAALPLEGGGRVFGVLSIFSEDRNAFGPEEMALLDELSQDLAFGITALRTRQELDQTALGLESVRKSFNTLFSTARDAVFILSPEHIVDCNHSAELLLGAPRDVILTTPPRRFFQDTGDGPKNQMPPRELIDAVINRGESHSLEYKLKNYSGEVLFAEVSVNRIELESGVFVQAVVRDVTERTATLRALQHSQRRLAEAQRIASIGDWEWDFKNDRLTWSDEVYRIFGIDSGDFDETYDGFLDMIHPDDRDAVDVATREALLNNKGYDIKHRILHPEGLRHVQERAVPHTDNGTPFMAGTVQDITDQILAEQEILTLNRRSDLILQAAGDGIFGLDEKGNIIFANPAGTAMLGYDKSSLIGKSLCGHAGTDDSPHKVEDCPIRATLEDGQCRHGRETFRRADSSLFPTDFMVTPIMDGDELTGAVVAIRDITGEMRAQERQARDLREKETLLKEIHHRVKNNMQIISSLLSLQSHELQSEHDKTLLKESMDRVRSMAFVHECLYQGGDLSSVNFARYITDVSMHLHGLYSSYQTPVSLETDLEDVRLDIAQAVPCGLIVNELVTNSLKHAFTPGKEGRITLGLSSNNGSVQLRIADNGSGMDPALFESGETFGLSLIQSLASQVGADLHVSAEGGTCVTLKIPLP